MPTTQPVVGEASVTMPLAYANGNVWYRWVTGNNVIVSYDGTIAEPAPGQMEVWRGWVTGTTVTFGSNVSSASTLYATGITNTIQDTVWGNWMNSTASTLTFPYQTSEAVGIPQETAEERTRREDRYREEAARRAEENRVLRAERDAALAEARRLADILLRDNLHPDQVQEYAEKSYFHVRAKSGKRYRITRGIAGNVLEMNDADQPVARLCIHPIESVPAEDNMLAQRLMLETDENQFLRIANRTRIA